MSANELAKALGVPTNRINEIIRGKRGISGDTALRLGRWFGTGPDIWMNLQKKLRTAAGGRGNRRALEKIPQPHEGVRTRNDPNLECASYSQAELGNALFIRQAKLGNYFRSQVQLRTRVKNLVPPLHDCLNALLSHHHQPVS